MYILPHWWKQYTKLSSVTALLYARKADAVNNKLTPDFIVKKCKTLAFDEDYHWSVNLMALHERIKEIRSAIGFSQAKFAERMAISSSYLANIELNNKPVTERIIRLLAAEFNVSDHWLRTGEGIMFIDGIDNQVSKLISAFKSLNQQFKECALNQIEDLANLYEKIKTKWRYSDWE